MSGVSGTSSYCLPYISGHPRTHILWFAVEIRATCATAAMVGGVYGY
jgi:hypothetical protein